VRCARALALPLLLALSCSREKQVKPVEVVFWQRGPLDATQSVVQRFEAGNPGVRLRVERLPAVDAIDSLAAAAEAGHPPDLCELDRGEVARFMEKGWLSDWSAGVADLAQGSRGWELCRLGDALYGLPWLLGTRVLLYNRTLLARAGLDSTRAPETWDELHVASARVSRLGHGVKGYGLASGAGERFVAYMPYAWGNGGEMLSARLDSCRFGSRENVQALAFLVSLVPYALVAPEDSLALEFAAGRLGFLLADTGAALDLLRPSAALRAGVGLVPRPEADGGSHASIGSGTVLASFTRSRRKEDGLRFARFMAEPQNVVDVASALGHGLPASLAADSAQAARGGPEARFLEQLETTRFAPIRRDGMEMEAAIDSLVGDALARRCAPRRAVAAADSLIRSLGVAR